MIQRKQTIWLFLAALCGVGFTQAPLYVGTANDTVPKEFITNESLLLFAVSIAISLLALVCIFLFKNRGTQMKMTIIGILASSGLIALEVWQIEEFKSANGLLKASYQWGSLLPILIVLFFILAASGIRKDQKLIKSLDRLR